ncbi:cell division protein SepF [Candidatus Woesearchaeota archaeon]|nr:cell division protein SepF [Candidatus Woesearchaeota archaeon]
MRSMIMKIKKSFGGKRFDPDDAEESYVELTTDSELGAKSKIVVRPFVLDDFASLKPILDVLREGYTIALINIKPLKDKDLVELKRAISKLKKTTDAIEGDIAGFGDDWIAVVPSFATIFREKPSTKEKEAPEELGEFD